MRLTFARLMRALSRRPETAPARPPRPSTGTAVKPPPPLRVELHAGDGAARALMLTRIGTSA